ncbi:hypothetical protein QVD17_19385 [Tagetes erecta]|uniref:Uncharacterized protein n=1 Tax=Tagetes erecta TaxID=13708 RepID=A0AAD8KM79_TARER|nr:hypothetical protein QVD17_19385 [Tagetes erecta]
MKRNIYGMICCGQHCTRENLIRFLKSKEVVQLHRSTTVERWLSSGYRSQHYFSFILSFIKGYRNQEFAYCCQVSPSYVEQPSFQDYRNLEFVYGD